MSNKEYPLVELKVLLGLLLVITIYSAISPVNHVKWLVQSAWVLVGIPLLLLTFSRFKFSPLVYRLVFIHACILLIGAHSTYQLALPGEWLKIWFGFERNHFDRVGHFAQGFVPAMIVREILLRRSPLVVGKWLFFIVLCVCMAISVWYEFLEWLAALLGPQEATAEATKIKYLGQQGDVWDTQWDMFMAMLGSLSAQIFCARIQDRQLANLRLWPRDRSD